MSNDDMSLLERVETPSRWAITRALIHRYQWFHLGMGLLGNTTFVIGSVFFLWQDWQEAGTWLFIVGSAGMLLGSIGSAIVAYERTKGRGPGEVQPGRGYTRS
ncbi:MAG: YrhK family protein [Alcanivorax sp.]|nr:YrhK family protein [Alcanivorax sp.]